MLEDKNVRLYSRAQVVIATFIGAPIAGALLMGKNYKALQRYESARQSLIIGIIATVVLLGFAFLLPDNFPNTIIPVVSLFAMAQWYKQTQEDSFSTHIADGGEKGSWGIAIGFGVLCMVIIIAIVIGAVMLLPESMI